jgi:hypothetical protein
MPWRGRRRRHEACCLLLQPRQHFGLRDTLLLGLVFHACFGELMLGLPADWAGRTGISAEE